MWEGVVGRGLGCVLGKLLMVSLGDTEVARMTSTDERLCLLLCMWACSFPVKQTCLPGEL